MEQEATSSSLSPPTEEEILQMEKLMSDGKRNYICDQPQLALKCFVELCEKIAKHYGQESGKCTEAYLYYGKTLLDIARLENGVLGSAVPETSDDAEIEEKDEKESNSENGASEGSAEVPEEAGKAAEEEGEDCDEEEGDEEEDVSNMELAWEMFELTSFICKKQLTEDGHNEKSVKTNFAEAKYGLAQISLETERYEEAVTDFRECLDVYNEILQDKNDRVLAEAHYNIALALNFDKQYAEAIKEFEAAVSILKARIQDLEVKVKESEENGGKGKASSDLEGWNKEIKDLNDIIVSDMMAKIEDAHESKKLLDESIKTVKDAASEMFSSLSGIKNGFDTGFDDGFDSPLTDATNTIIHDCSSNIRSVKRKNDDTSISPVKKVVKTTLIAETNGTTEGSLATAENGST